MDAKLICQTVGVALSERQLSSITCYQESKFLHLQNNNHIHRVNHQP
jgi:hypothetical protein